MTADNTRKKYRAILIPKTHWDREHSRSFEQLRWHLVHNVVDPLLDILANDPHYKVFMFDGQSLAIDDYLEMRPEREAEIKRLVREKRLVIGPFLVGPDEHLPSGESLVRCLLLGHQMAQGYGGVMKVGYNPDAFGHVAQLPQILRGFDIDAAAFMRGVGPEIGEWGTDFLWIAPDGSDVLATHFLYVNAGFLTDDIDQAAKRLGKSVAEMQPKELPYFVLMHGEDGSVPYKKLPEAVRRANDVLEDIEIEQGTLEDYFDLLRPFTDRLPRYQGELRKGAYTVVLSGVYSSRTYFKQENVRTQTLLERYAEPLAAFAWSIYGDRHPDTFLAKAWRQLAENHFHDIITSQVRHHGIEEEFWFLNNLTTWGHPFPAGTRTRTFDLSFLAEDLPPCGYRTYYYCEIAAARQNFQHPFLRAQSLPATDLQVTNRAMENSFLAVACNADGTLDVADKTSGHVYRGLQTDTVQAESAFHVIDREIELEDGAGWEDPPVPWAPHQSFVSISDGKTGLTVVNKGIPEYAAEKESDGVVLSLTLLRATGWIGREFFNSGFYKIATPDAQSPGPQEFDYALVAHVGTWSQAKVWRDAHEFNAPCEVTDPVIYPHVFPWDCGERPTIEGRAGEATHRTLPSGDNPQEAGFLSLDPPELVLTAIKKAEKENALVVRLYNISDRAVDADLWLQGEITRAWKTNMLEEDREAVDVSPGDIGGQPGTRVNFPVKAHEIVTVKLAQTSA